MVKNNEKNAKSKPQPYIILSVWACKPEVELNYLPTVVLCFVNVVDHALNRDICDIFYLKCNMFLYVLYNAPLFMT